MRIPCRDSASSYAAQGRNAIGRVRFHGAAGEPLHVRTSHCRGIPAHGSAKSVGEFWRYRMLERSKEFRAGVRCRRRSDLSEAARYSLPTA